MNFLRKHRAVGLDVGSVWARALVLERRRSDLVVVGRGAAPIESDGDAKEATQAIHAALADAGASGEPVIAAIGGPDVVIRQIAMPPLPRTKILPAIEIQYRELGLPAPRDSVTDAQILRAAKGGDVSTNDILSVSVPRRGADARVRMLQHAAVKVRMLDVEPLALLNGAIHLTGLEAGEMLVLLSMGHQTSVLCLFSEQGPVVARYLDVGSQAFSERLRDVLPGAGSRRDAEAISAGDLPKAEAACREPVDRIAEDIRLSLTFYRTEYDRESLPRYAIGGAVNVPHISRWVADRLGLDAPLELMDPFRVIEVRAPQTRADLSAMGSQFLQAFGLALRGV
jgi:Tfp pilus assembly PilM family ATPase